MEVFLERIIVIALIFTKILLGAIIGATLMFCVVGCQYPVIIAIAALAGGIIAFRDNSWWR